MSTLPRGRTMTRADLDALPDDGWRHELIDGALVMTPAPSPRHQRVAFKLAVLLNEACPADLEVLIAPLDVVLGPDTVVEPDVLVARRSDLTARDLTGVPVLVVEVLSPSTTHIDLGLKRRRYEVAGCPSYWVVAPGSDDEPPSVTAWQLRGDAYVEAGRAVGSEPLRVDSPYPLIVAPASLVE